MAGVKYRGWKSSFISAPAWAQDGGYLSQVGSGQRGMGQACLRDQGEQVFDRKSNPEDSGEA